MNAFMPKASLAFLNCCQSCQIVCLLGQEEDESHAARGTDTFSGSIISAQLTDIKNNIRFQFLHLLCQARSSTPSFASQVSRSTVPRSNEIESPPIPNP